MPHSRFLFAPVVLAPPVAQAPSLSRGYVTFGSFNNTAKLNGSVIRLWARIMLAVPNARLVLKWRTFNDPEFCEEFKGRFNELGVAPSRLDLRPWSDHADTLNQYADIDIALDPFPFSGGYTSYEALWMGVPLVSLPSQRPISRQGLCLLSNIACPDLIANSEEEYLDIAVRLANDPSRLTELRASLRDKITHSPLLDASSFAHDFQNLLTSVANLPNKNNPLPSNSRDKPMHTFLHVGCGPKRKDMTTPGFNTAEWQELRFDIDPGVQPDLVGTMLDMSAVADESVDAIYSSHNIEHLYPYEVPLALREFLRVLKPDGFLVITCPDLQSVAQLIAEDKLIEPAYMSPAGPIAPIDILYGHRPQLAAGNHYMAHKCGFTESVLQAVLQGEGFPRIATMRRGCAPYFDLFAVASKNERTDDELRALAIAHLPVSQPDKSA